MLTRFQINTAAQTGEIYPATLNPAARLLAAAIARRVDFMGGAK